MNSYVLIIAILGYPSFVLTENTNSNTSMTQTPWFWPLISICIALLLSIPCTMLTVLVFCHHKHSNDEESSTSSSSSSTSSISLPQPSTHRHRHRHPHRSHYAGAYRSPPPPYVTNDQPENVFVTPSLPPPYESPLRVEPTVINVHPQDGTESQSSTNHSQLPATLDASSVLTNTSLQTFQA